MIVSLLGYAISYLLKTAHLALFESCSRAGRLRVKVSPVGELLTSLSLVFGTAHRKK